MGGNLDRRQPSKARVKWLLTAIKKVLSITFSQLGLCGLVGLYAVAGAFIFRRIEGPYEKARLGHMKRDMETMVKKIVDYTASQDHLDEDEWKGYAESLLKEYERLVVNAYNSEGYEGDDDVHNIQWTFSGSLLYAITVFTTIGYGNLTPKTEVGKIVTIVYATIGIPLMLLCLANIAESMADVFAWIYYNVFCFYGQWSKRKRRLGRAMLVARHLPSRQGMNRKPTLSTKRQQGSKP